MFGRSFPDNKRSFELYADAQKERLIGHGIVTQGVEVSDLSDTAMQEFLYKYIDIHYAQISRRLSNPQEMCLIPISPVVHDMACVIQMAANYVVEDALENTSNGNWCTYYDEFEKAIGVSTDTIMELKEAIKRAIEARAEVAEVELVNDSFDVICWLDYCRNLDPSEMELAEQADHEDNIRVLRILPEQPPEVAIIPNTVAALQAEVHGHIEMVTQMDGAVIVVNEEGKLTGMQVNRVWGDDILVGPILVCGTKGEDLASLTDEQIQTYTEQFAQPIYTVQPWLEM